MKLKSRKDKYHMTFLWLIIWLLSRTPAVYTWNNWAIGLAICIAIDILD